MGYPKALLTKINTRSEAVVFPRAIHLLYALNVAGKAFTLTILEDWTLQIKEVTSEAKLQSDVKKKSKNLSRLATNVSDFH